MIAAQRFDVAKKITIARLRFAARLFCSGPKQLVAVVDASWYHDHSFAALLRQDLVWLKPYHPALKQLPDINVDKSTFLPWLELMCVPLTWRATLKSALRNAWKHHTYHLHHAVWKRNITKIFIATDTPIPSFFCDQLPPEPYICLEDRNQ